jgi:hypothetical protein
MERSKPMATKLHLMLAMKKASKPDARAHKPLFVNSPFKPKVIPNKKQSKLAKLFNGWGFDDE